jgi:outer membrane protein assembly factor BamD (BamD/ComL family)
MHRADLAADLGNWEDATHELRGLETQFMESESPARHPSEIRFLTAAAQTRAGADPESTRVVLESLLEDFPESEVAPRALLALSLNAILRNEPSEALDYLDRIREDYPDNDRISSEALLGRGRLLEQQDGRWPEALQAFRAVSVEHPLSEAALQAPLEIAGHYARVEDEEAELAALQRAEREYRAFIDRYPQGPLTFLAQEQLARTLAFLGKHREAVTTMERLGTSAIGTPRGTALLLSAVQGACDELADTTLAISILERIGESDPRGSVRTWARQEADRLGGASSP